MKRILVVGEPMVELSEETSGVLHRGFGGDALNVAVYLARSAPEHRVALATAVGDDPSSDALVQLCRSERVETSHIVRVPGGRIGVYRVTVDEVGERTFAYDRSQSVFRGWLDDEGGLPDPAEVDVLIFSGIAIAVLHPVGRHALARFAKTVHARGTLVVYDTNHRPSLWDDAAEAPMWLGRILPSTDIVLASADDGRALFGLGQPSAIAAAIQERGVAEVIVTDGGRPCSLIVADRAESVAAIAVVSVVDTTAAGDAFDAGYVAARLRHLDPAEAALAGHRVAARVVAHRGAIVPGEIGR